MTLQPTVRVGRDLDAVSGATSARPARPATGGRRSAGRTVPVEGRDAEAGSPSPARPPSPLEVEGLVRRYRPLARSVSRLYFAAGYDSDDLEQEALVALLLAARRFDASCGITFAGFARTLIQRRLVDVVKYSRRVRRLRPGIVGEWDDDRVASPAPGPQELVEQRETFAALAAAVRALTDLEREALGSVVAGVPYKRTGLVAKQVDNAVQRARRKLKAAA